MEHDKKHLVLYFQNIRQVVFGIFFLIFPLFFFSLTTDTFIVPKEILLGFVALLSLLLFGAQVLIEKKVSIRQTFLDLPVGVFVLCLFLSSVFSVNRLDSLISVMPILFLGIAYFVIVNLVLSQNTAFFLLSSLSVSAVLVSITSIFSYFKIYLFPFAFTHVQTFSTLGDPANQTMYLLALLPIPVYFALPLIKGKAQIKPIIFGIFAFVIFTGVIVSLYETFAKQQPLLLPFISGFQIAFAAISQDSPRIAQAFFFGSGFGTFLSDFTRFKQAAFNQNQSLWFQYFSQSSSFILELLATTGILGILSFFFILGKASTKFTHTIKNPLFPSIVILVVFSFILPFSFTTLALFFFVLALFSCLEGLKHPEKSLDLEIFLITLKKNLFNEGNNHSHQKNLLMPIIVDVIILAIVGVLGFYSTTYVMADVFFNQSLAAATNNNGSQTYQKQVQAISIFPYRDVFYRIFSQTNMTIANSLLKLASAQGKTPSQQTQQTALNLIQQAISTAKQATVLAPQTVTDWQNLASVYRSLTGIGQNADQFTVASMNQAILLDPTNPQEYIQLGGFYYQLGQYDKAIPQFQTAASLKQDYANAYYNLGHAYQQKGDTKDALAQYEIVKQLVASDKTNLAKITSEIDALNNTTNPTDQTISKGVKTQQNITNSQPLSVNSNITPLPTQEQKIPLQDVSPTPR